MNILPRHRTNPHPPEMYDRLASTHAGMASLGVGPGTCRTCVHWATRFWVYTVRGQEETDARVETFRRVGDELRPRACKKFYLMMGHRLGPAVPHHALACRFHVLNESAPQVVVEKTAKGKRRERRRSMGEGA